MEIPLQALPHDRRHAVLGRNRQQHVDAVGHEVPLYYLDPLVAAQLPEDLPYVEPHLAVGSFCLYFVVNTMWYLHIHFVCERL